MTFDPYYTWLGIPPADQPANHYRLLAIERFEPSGDVISNAADRLMAYLRVLSGGPQASVAQRLLNEAAAARICLLDAGQKAHYDATLRARTKDALPDEAPAAAERPVATARPTSDQPAGPKPVRAPGGPKPPAKGGNRFADYEVLGEIKKDATGTIYRARRADGRLAALKVLSDNVIESPELFARFQRKVGILAKLRHENLVRAFQAGRHEGRVFLATEYVDGRNLAAWLAEIGPLPLQHTLHYLKQAAAGLGYAHQNGVIHRNVKPENLLVDNQTGAIKVVGLGLARLAEYAVLSNAGGFHTEPGRQGMGTLDYMAPEQIVDSGKADARSDVYALGCTLFHLLAGRVPYPEKGPMRKALAHQRSPIPSLQAARTDAPLQLDLTFQRMVAKSPDDRFATMEDVAAVLAAI